MRLLEREYLNWRLQKYLDGLQLRQTRKNVKLEELREAFRHIGALQTEDAPEGENVYRWEFLLKGDETDPLFLSHCNVRFFYVHRGNGNKWQLAITMGMFSSYICRREDPQELADEIVRIDREIIPRMRNDFENLSPEELTSWALFEYKDQFEVLRKRSVILDSTAAAIYGVTVTEVRQVISRNKRVYQDENIAFHLTYDELVARNRRYLKPLKTRKSDYLPYAITERGFCMLSMHLHSPIATKVCIGIIQTVAKNVPLAEMLKKFVECMKREEG